MALPVKSVRMLGLVLVIIIALKALFIVADQKFQMTSGAEFCGSCHSMKPMTVSYLDDSHAKVAVCADCHLPQDNILNHYFHKAQHGVRDLIQEHVIGTEQIDWVQKLSNSAKFVYESGCLSCHQIQDKNNELALSHKPHMGDNKMHCVLCHQVGHKGLRQLLERQSSMDAF
jgi:cytochrome c-type protein NapC